MTDFYVEGHTAEGFPYGPVHVLTTPLEEMWGEAEQAREDAWRESAHRARAVMRKGKGEDIG